MGFLWLVLRFSCDFLVLLWFFPCFFHFSHVFPTLPLGRPTSGAAGKPAQRVGAAAAGAGAAEPGAAGATGGVGADAAEGVGWVD